MDKNLWYQCGRKRRYRDEHTVNCYRKRYEKARGKKLDYYWCSHCKGFHLTSVEANTRYFEEISMEGVG